MRLAPDGYAQQISLSSLKQILIKASEISTPIMVFTCSVGCIQIHTGEIKKLVQTGPWLNVLDPEFNMHLREDGIDSIWLVKKPTADSMVNSIEVYDKGGIPLFSFLKSANHGK